MPTDVNTATTLDVTSNSSTVMSVTSNSSVTSMNTVTTASPGMCVTLSNMQFHLQQTTFENFGTKEGIFWVFISSPMHEVQAELLWFHFFWRLAVMRRQHLRLLTLYRLHFASNLHESLSDNSSPQILDKFETGPYEVKN